VTNLAIATNTRAIPRVPGRHRAPSEEIDLVVQLAHDIRSPLSGILMLTESLQSGTGGPLTDSQKRLLELIRGAALSLCVSASDVVEMAMDGKGLGNERAEEFSVTEVLRAVRDMASPLAAGKHLDLRIGAPSIDQRRGRSRSITRVLLNLVTNALKCTEDGTVDISATEVPGNRDRIVFSVRDSGPGLESAMLLSLDQPRRLSAQRKSLTSSGLGLSICRSLMEQMGSTLHFETSAGEGTRFYFEIHAPCV
jgi:signal transduction histidine kinase